MRNSTIIAMGVLSWALMGMGYALERPYSFAIGAILWLTVLIESKDET